MAPARVVEVSMFGGVDTHKDLLVTAVVDQVGRVRHELEELNDYRTN